jgi:hypothetical protein
MLYSAVCSLGQIAVSCCEATFCVSSGKTSALSAEVCCLIIQLLPESFGKVLHECLSFLLFLQGNASR